MSKFDPYEHLNVSLNSDGSLTRYVKLPTSAATGEAPRNPSESALSHDVTLNSDKNTWMRIYRPARIPSNDNAVVRLPIIFYFRPGGWIQRSIAETIIHGGNERLAAEVPAIVVAVEYRLAPESRLPAQYDDAIDAVVWVRNQAAIGNDGFPWIRDFADRTRCYLYGASCGANIAFQAALRLPEIDLKPLVVAGTILNQPFFGSMKRTKSELKLATDQFFPLPVQDLLWELALPPGTNRDHHYSNPFTYRGMQEKLKSLGRCLIIGFAGDPLVDRQQDFVRMLVEEGIMVEARFDDAGFHGIDLIDSRRASAIHSFIKDFV
ncbi:probable carboxylesterase 9 [Andrographis paniculata]|uniref:probable carboxylesterase 9 n=1 Tax=Andrographis paniculata TaxID=175694 RepID=UPI0021E75D0D|nr:probable carboxylesterase 9 [Andrographis paniculata]